MNKQIRQITPLILTFLLMWGCAEKPAPEGISTASRLQELFADPPSEYRSAPLWDWNEQITEEGIDFQMKEFKKAGIGGVFVHPRPGLLTEYLSDEWFHLFDYTVQKGKELDMKVWIYDENSYPSGFAGGHVPAEMPDSYQHGAGLSLEIREILDIALTDTVEVVLKKTETGFEDLTQTASDRIGQPGPWYIFKKTYPGNSPWYGGFTYVDLLYPGVTQKFLELTMTKGYEKSMADFGTTLPGVFTDEPNLEAAMSRGTLLRWTPDLWTAFDERWGYDLRPHLPSLVEETGDWKKVRHDFYELILEMFVDRWAKPWYAYCEEKNLDWTGHYWEHGWPEPTHGFDEAAFYIWHQMPGVDMLGNRLDTAGLGGQFGNDRAVRELLSAANQAGYKRTLSETYGGAGWELNFEEQKRLADWQGVMGVNFVNQHLSYYSLNGVRKFDYPPSFSYHEPWWEHYRLMGDYIGRLSMAMASGDQINTTLVLQPNTTAWMYFSRKQKNQAIDVIRKDFKNFVYQLEQHHIEYDLGSENVLRELGSAEGKLLRVGKRDYSLVVIPKEMENIDRTTLEMLRQYLEGGGKVLSFIPAIERIDGAESAEATEMAADYPDQWISRENLAGADVLNLLKNDGFSINDITANGMLYHQRRILNDGQLLLVVNSHPGQKARAEITMKGKHVTLFDLVSGKTSSYPAEREKGNVTFSTELFPAGSALFAVTQKPLTDEMLPAEFTDGSTVASSGEMTVDKESDNILMINYLDLKTAKSEKKDLYFMNALNGLFKDNGVDMGNPWQHKIQYRKNYLDLDTLFSQDSWFEASYHFYMAPGLEAEKISQLRAVVERPDLWEVSINGNVVSKTENAHWIEQSFPVFAIGEFVKSGKNTLKIRAPRMHVLAEVMPVYILGDFLVQPSEQGFEITSGAIGQPGSWREAGLPFYSQKVAYTRIYDIKKDAGSRWKVKLNAWTGTVADVLVNGEHAGVIAWKPYEKEITGFLKEGSNIVTVRVTGSLKNTFGFFYQPNTSWIHGPHSWNYAPEKKPDASGYYLMDYGLMEPFEVVGNQ